MHHEDRILALGSPATLAPLEEILGRDGIRLDTCSTPAGVASVLEDGANALVVEPEVVGDAGLAELRRVLEHQPAWSDLPVILIGPRDATARPALRELADVATLSAVDVPLDPDLLQGVVQGALRTRNRQYQGRELMQRLAEEDRQKDRFLAMLGHELRNPLGVIRTGLALLDRMPDPVERQRQIRRLERHLGMLSHLVDDLLDLARLSGGGLRLQKGVLDLGRVVAETVSQSSAEAKRRGQTIGLELPGHPVWVEGDETRLDQAIGHLIDNAIRYTREPGAVRVRVDERNGRAVVEVADQGVGIDADRLETIFEAFTRLEGMVSGESGLGLGLPLVREIVGLHGGEIEAESGGSGRGSQFTIRLPLAREPAASSANHPERVAPAAGRRVLVVEDLEDAREALGELLRLSGFEVDLAPDGASALALAERSTPEVALLDIGLPDIDGLEVARRLRRRHGKTVRLVAMSGYGQEKDRRAALDAGFDEHLVKPVDPGRLFAALAGG